MQTSVDNDAFYRELRLLVQLKFDEGLLGSRGPLGDSLARETQRGLKFQQLEIARSAKDTA
jgi:hypothetical protein